MTTSLLTLDDGLRLARRVSLLAVEGGREVRVAELLALVLTGAVAAVVTNVVRFRLGIPGSSIVWAVFPMAFGLALVPRRGAGSVMAIGALLTSGVLGASGVRLDGVGAQVSLLATGPLLDAALRWGSHGWRLHLAFVGACAASNSLAFVARAAVKWYGLPLVRRGHFGWGGGGGGGGGGGRLPFDLWLPQALWTYAAAGLVAGLLSAAIWFHVRERRETSG